LSAVPVKIRLMRVGKTKQPSYRVVVADGRSPRDGQFLEILGTYAPRHEPTRVEIDADRAVAWLHKGARPTETAHRLLAVTGIWERYESERGKPARPPKPAGIGPKQKRKKKPEPETPAAPAAAAEPAAQAAPEPEPEKDDAAGEAPAEAGDTDSSDETNDG
jgi:small subunit ribosomal protein S16